MKKNLRIVLLGNTRLNYSWFILTHRQGLQLNGVDVIDLDYKSHSLQQIKKFILDVKPNYVFDHMSFHESVNPIGKVLTTFKEIANHDIKIIHFVNDARTHDRYMGNLQGIYYMGFAGTHEMVVNCQKAWGIPVFYSPYSSLCYDQISIPAKDLRFQEAIFTGSVGAHPDRQSFIQRLSKKIPVRVFQTQSGNDLRNRTPELSASARCILGLCTGYDIPGYIDVRPFQYLGTGACMIMRKFSNMDDMMPDSLYYPITSYGSDGVREAVDHWHRILREDTTEMQKAAFGYIQRFHSCKVRIQKVLDYIRRG